MPASFSASANGGRLTSSPGRMVTWLTASPSDAKYCPSKENDPPASMMNTRGRWTAITISRS